MTTEQEQKQKAIDILRAELPRHEQTLRELDPRLHEYIEDVATHSSAREDDDDDVHNLYEVLGAVRFLRLLDTYPFNRRKFQTVVKLREGGWEQDGKTWRHVGGGLKCPGTTGPQYYRWQPFQVFVLASVFGFMAWVDTQMEAGTKTNLLPTERERNGKIWDYRRLCTDFTYFAPRKTDKTGLAAFIQVVFFFFEDTNAECYCCANSSSQSSLLFSRTRQLISQLDAGERIRSTQTVIDWREAYKGIRDSSVRPLSAGGKTKDGMFAQLCCADEFGSAPYTNGKSDMLGLVNVIQSSMGPRREPLTFTTTTAGTITSGPFIEKLSALHTSLLRELDYAQGEAVPTFEDDRRLCLCLEPDEWECEEEVILNKKSLRRKVNPMLGLIVQHASYDGWISEARDDQTKMPELIAKYFNHYVTGKVKEWVKSDKIRPLQEARRIEDCKYADGWQTFVGLDFSHGDDLFAVTYLSIDMRPSSQMSARFFADMEAWVLEDTMMKSPNRQLYEMWVAQGWLKVCPGQVFDSAYAIAELAKKNEAGVNMVMFGFDPAQNRQPINSLKAWLQTLGIDARTIQAMVVPVSQGAMTQNPLISELEVMILEREPWIRFSNNPMWPWEFGNAAVEIGKNDLRRLTKGGPVASAKMDNVAALLDALYCFDLSEGRVE